MSDFNRYDYLCEKEMFDVNINGQYCGVLVPTHVMKKLMKISNEWSSEVRKLLTKHKDELLVSDWNACFPKDESGKILGSVTVTYSDKDEWTTVDDRINMFKPVQPNKKDVYLCDRKTAETIAWDIYNEKVGKDK